MNSKLVLRERHQLTGENKKKLLQKEREIFRLIKNEVERLPHVNGKYNRSLISFLIIAMCHWMGYWFQEKRELSHEEAINQNLDIIFGGIQSLKGKDQRIGRAKKPSELLQPRR